ncbi:MAG: molybdopterin-dependent oxidoreductase [bacterium]|nr:molybdopterin-dependent oxidoreductase [bacterium]
MNKKTLKTMCARDCYDSCLLTATVDKNGKLESLRGDSHSIVTNGFTCPRGAKDLVHLYTNRVPAPKVRSNTKFAEKFQQVDWDNALSMAAKKLEETISKYGKDSVLLLDYAGNTGLVTSAYTHRLWNALGTAETDGGVCNISGQEALKLHYGNYYGLQPEELPNKDLVVFWGINAPVSSPHMWGLSSQARKKTVPKSWLSIPGKARLLKMRIFFSR